MRSEEQSSGLFAHDYSYRFAILYVDSIENVLFRAYTEEKDCDALMTMNNEQTTGNMPSNNGDVSQTHSNMDALKSGSTKNVEKWGGLMYNLITEKLIPQRIPHWFYRCRISVQANITHERPQFHTFYQEFYKVLEKIIQEDIVDYDTAFAYTFA